MYTILVTTVVGEMSFQQSFDFSSKEYADKACNNFMQARGLPSKMQHFVIKLY